MKNNWHSKVLPTVEEANEFARRTYEEGGRFFPVRVTKVKGGYLVTWNDLGVTTPEQQGS